MDHFEGSREHKEMQLDMSNLDAIFHRNIKPIADALPSRFFVFVGSSVEAAGQFSDRELDFVMLDGSHEYEDVLADIRVWSPKVKPGGMLAGDDWQFKGVSSAVTEEFSRNVVIIQQQPPISLVVSHQADRARNLMWSYELFDRCSAVMLVVRYNGEPIGALTFRLEQKEEVELWITQLNQMNRTKKQQSDVP